MARSLDTLVQMSLDPLIAAKMRVAKAEAQEIANREGRGWEDVYYERHLADKELHYEGNIPKALPVEDFNDIIDEVDLAFRQMLRTL